MSGLEQLVGLLRGGGEAGELAERQRVAVGAGGEVDEQPRRDQRVVGGSVRLGSELG